MKALSCLMSIRKLLKSKTSLNKSNTKLIKLTINFKGKESKNRKTKLTTKKLTINKINKREQLNDSL